jgi:hypothetical protein
MPDLNGSFNVSHTPQLSHGLKERKCYSHENLLKVVNSRLRVGLFQKGSSYLSEKLKMVIKNMRSQIKSARQRPVFKTENHAFSC